VTPTRRRLARLLLAACALAAAGCAGFGRLCLEPGERAATRLLSPAALAERVWTAAPGRYYLRQAALFEFGQARVSADGLVRLDTGSGEARLVAVNEMGVKLFDLSVTRETVTENFLLPDLARVPGLTRSVAACLRAVYLDHRPRPTDALTTGRYTYELRRREGEGELVCTFSGLETLLLKEYEAPGESWAVRFHDYRPTDGLLVAGRTVFTDRRAGYRVTLLLQEVKRADD
jgi:hypothetical protein